MGLEAYRLRGRLLGVSLLQNFRDSEDFGLPVLRVMFKQERMAFKRDLGHG